MRRLKLVQSQLLVQVQVCRRQCPGGPLGLDRSWDGLFQPFPVPSGGGLPHILARSATTLDFSRPDVYSRYGLSARQIAKATRLSRGLGFVSCPRRFDPPRRTGWIDPFAGWVFHPLRVSTFARRQVWRPRIASAESQGWAV